ncbi:tetratricopeptide repeat protein [Sphingomonas glaciei]|uniref:Tetratricopeptide repeat protein n=1 Tax=Sphingomonas glaciei TaxID=2938948 RepID=A0ABY5MWK5_9SPHN|nr:hypothetical protein [Sphingomonas glaciei]UUR08648.1 hypothetical protein M1K48_03130 [Sphingomonas glaciei]
MSIRAKALLAAFLVTAAAPVPALAQAAPASSIPAPSKEARPALAALQKAVNENKTAEIPALSQAALAAAKTPADRYYAYQLQLKPAVASKNDDQLLAVLEGMLGTGLAQGADLANLSFNAAKINYNKGAADAAASAKAATQIEQALAADPNKSDYYLVLGELRNRQKRPAEAVAALQKAMALDQAAGKPVDQKVSDRALAFAYNARLPVARDLAVANLKAAPNPKNWRAAIKITEQVGNLPATDKVDLFRLQRATSSFEGEADYYPYVDVLMTRGLPGEAKAVLDEAFAAGKLDKNKPMWRDLYSSAVTRSAGDKSAPNGDVYLGRGDYAKAAAAYRADVAKGGAGADLANLRLGIALARSGDKAGATAALSAVKGTRSNIAQLWMMYLERSA